MQVQGDRSFFEMPAECLFTNENNQTFDWSPVDLYSGYYCLQWKKTALIYIEKKTQHCKISFKKYKKAQWGQRLFSRTALALSKMRI